MKCLFSQENTCIYLQQSISNHYTTSGRQYSIPKGLQIMSVWKYRKQKIASFACVRQEFQEERTAVNCHLQMLVLNLKKLSKLSPYDVRQKMQMKRYFYATQKCQTVRRSIDNGPFKSLQTSGLLKYCVRYFEHSFSDVNLDLPCKWPKNLTTLCILMMRILIPLIWKANESC